MLKNFLTIMLLAVGVILCSQASAASLPFRTYDYSYEFFGSGTIREHFTIENVSDRKVSLYIDDFVMKKSGRNTVKPGHFGGGFSRTITSDYKVYTEKSVDLYPGDVIEASLDYDTHDSTASGWAMYYSNYNGLIQLTNPIK